MNKLIVIDYSIFVHRAIFSWRNSKQIPPEYTCLNMILSCLRRIGIDPMDEIIVACDGKDNWRKKFSTEYKANRKEFRESFEDIDWGQMFYKFDILLEKLNNGTSWHIVKIDTLEADDIAGIICKHYKDKEIVLVSFDGDWEQLMYYDNVKVFSPLIKFKGGKGAYKVKKPSFNVYKFLSKKINKEVSDNLISPILSKEDFERRKMLVSLIDLPEFVEAKVLPKINNLPEKDWDINYVPFKTIRNKLSNLYNDREKLITYEDCVNRKKRKRRKK